MPVQSSDRRWGETVFDLNELLKRNFDIAGCRSSSRASALVGLLLINKDLIRSVTVAVSVTGYNYATKGTRYDYGKLLMDAGKTITEAPIDNLGANFSVEVPRYGITAIVIPKAE